MRVTTTSVCARVWSCPLWYQVCGSARGKTTRYKIMKIIEDLAKKTCKEEASITTHFLPPSLTHRRA